MRGAVGYADVVEVPDSRITQQQKEEGEEKRDFRATPVNYAAPERGSNIDSN